MNKAQPESLFLRRRLAFGRRLASRHPAALIVLARAVAAFVLVAGIATVAIVMFALSWQTDSAIAAIVAAGWVAFGDLRNPGL
jgi:ribosomal protein S11